MPTKIPGRLPLGIKVIGVFKLVSAALLIALAIGIFKEIGTDPAIETEHIVSMLKLDPGNKYIHAAMSKVSQVSTKQLYAISAGTFAYAVLYAIEATGLLLRRRWGEYFTVLMTGLFIPFEVYEVFHKPSGLKLLILALNAAIVVYLVAQVVRNRKVDRGEEPATPAAGGPIRVV